jgi:hypothetical protein
MLGKDLKVLTSKAEPQMLAIAHKEFGEDWQKLKV